MANWQWFGRLHTATYVATGGRIGGKLVGLPMLLLTTTGRKSGLPRTSPLPYFMDEDRWVIVGSNNAEPRDPMWWFNLRQTPSAKIQIMGEQFGVVSRLATPEERTRLWPLLVDFNPPYARYAEKTTREIPVVILSRSD